MEKRGKVYLIGAGPGNPGLLTRRAEEVLSRADVVLYDALVDRRILGGASTGAELIFVGKRGGKASPKQEEINRFLIKKARAGKIVARIKGGDPFVLGRGAEEALALARNKVEFELVPGVTSAIAAPAYAGIPLTHRDLASSFTVVTGQEDPTKPESGINWKALAEGKGTLVFLMGIRSLDDIVRHLVSSGLDPSTPAGIVENGTYSHQRTITGTVKNIPARARKAKIKAPAALVVGPVVGLRRELNWYEKMPLFGRKIVVTRTREQASQMSRYLREAGGEVAEFPTIEIVVPRKHERLDRAIKEISAYDWLVLTSPNGARVFIQRTLEVGRDIRDLKGIKIAAVGPATEEELRGWGIKVDAVPKEFYTARIPDAIGRKNIKGKRFLLARSDKSDPELQKSLKSAGGKVEDLICYRTIKPRSYDPEIRRMVLKGDFDGITFTSSSTAENFVKIFGRDRSQRILRGKLVAAIGKVTSQTLRNNQIRVGIVARRATVPDLAEAIISHYSRAGKRKVR